MLANRGKRANLQTQKPSHDATMRRGGVSRQAKSKRAVHARKRGHKARKHVDGETRHFFKYMEL